MIMVYVSGHSIKFSGYLIIQIEMPNPCSIQKSGLYNSSKGELLRTHDHYLTIFDQVPTLKLIGVHAMPVNNEVLYVFQRNDNI